MEIIKTLTGKYLIQKRGKIKYTSSQSKATKIISFYFGTQFQKNGNKEEK